MAVCEAGSGQHRARWRRGGGAADSGQRVTPHTLTHSLLAPAGVLVQALGAPPHLRKRAGLTHLLTLLPGTRDRNAVTSSIQPLMSLIVDELCHLEVNGMDVNGRRVRVQLLRVVGDYRGLAGIVGSNMKQAPARHGCFRTWVEGYKACFYKTLYQIHARCAHGCSSNSSSQAPIMPGLASCAAAAALTFAAFFLFAACCTTPTLCARS